MELPGGARTPEVSVVQAALGHRPNHRTRIGKHMHRVSPLAEGGGDDRFFLDPNASRAATVPPSSISNSLAAMLSVPSWEAVYPVKGLGDRSAVGDQPRINAPFVVGVR